MWKIIIIDKNNVNIIIIQFAIIIIISIIKYCYDILLLI
jgi:hypothetical protein